MAIARMTEKSNDIKVIDVPSGIKELQVYLENLKGTICSTVENFVLNGLDLQIENYEKERKRYQDDFNRLKKLHPEIKRLCDIPRIADIGAVKLVARVVDANRFPTRNHFLSYCGLIKLEKMSGGKVMESKNHGIVGL
jgi:transposase